MSDQILAAVVSIAVAIIGIAALAVIVSQRAQTSSVLGSAGSAFSNTLSTALSPVTGSGTGILGGNSAGSYSYQ
jgi:PRD1 phage membrane DNA delivery